MNTSNPNEITDSQILWHEFNGHLQLEKIFELRGDKTEEELHKNYRLSILGSVIIHWLPNKKPII